VFCSYTILEETPDVFVIEDCAADPRFANFDVVKGPPHVRFYAGTALVVEKVKVGTLCLMDVKPRSFSTEDRMNLLDVGAAASALIKERCVGIYVSHLFFFLISSSPAFRNASQVRGGPERGQGDRRDGPRRDAQPAHAALLPRPHRAHAPGNSQ